MGTLKQDLWRKRAWLLCKMSGQVFDLNSPAITTQERMLLTKIDELRRQLLRDFNNSSKALGFNIDGGRNIFQHKKLRTRH